MLIRFIFVDHYSWPLGFIPPVSMLASVPLHLSGSGTSSSVFPASSVGAGPPPTFSISSPLSSVLPLSPQVSPAALAPTSQASTVASGVVLSSVAGPLPQKLVDKVKSGQFIEMREFLVDNMLLLERLKSVPGLGLLPVLSSGSRPRLREVSDPVSWVSCFLAYVAILIADPLVQAQLAYARLILGEAQCHGGSGWLEYDRAFRQQ